MSILDDRGGGWRSISSTNDVGIVGGPQEIFRHLEGSTARKGWEPLNRGVAAGGQRGAAAPPVMGSAPPFGSPELSAPLILTPFYLPHSAGWISKPSGPPGPPGPP